MHVYTLLCKAMVVMLPNQKTNSHLNYGFEQCWISLITTTSSSYLKKFKIKEPLISGNLERNQNQRIC
jgi:hypothetical protein